MSDMKKSLLTTRPYVTGAPLSIVSAAAAAAASGAAGDELRGCLAGAASTGDAIDSHINADDTNDADDAAASMVFDTANASSNSPPPVDLRLALDAAATAVPACG